MNVSLFLRTAKAKSRQTAAFYIPPNSVIRLAPLTILFTILGLASLSSMPAVAEDFRDAVQPLINTSCIDCHEGDENELDFSELQNDLNDAATFRKWEQIYDRIALGEMPPPSEDRPDPKIKNAALASLRAALTTTVRKNQSANGRVILRRLNRTEYGYTVRDLFGFEKNLSSLIPAENASTSFDTVFNNQGLSELHIESFLNAADAALTATIELGRKPKEKKQRFPYKEQEGVRKHFEEDKVIVLETDDAVVMFQAASYIFKVHGLDLEHHGRYRIRADVAAYQTERPVTFTLNAGSYQKGSQRVLGFFDLEPGKSKVIELETHLDAHEYLFPGAKVCSLPKTARAFGMWVQRTTRDRESRSNGLKSKGRSSTHGRHHERASCSRTSKSASVTTSPGREIGTSSMNLSPASCLKNRLPLS